ncbi:MAG: hypothetical protein A2283_05095 [Lentisphaerae bacterium RIFOXYA12_FULL_48_11]|nr:MAG: hypothetical protein A2283_05095 [Lentisphaerae bacterium RIFOXYA12_FULL_48_11]
MTELEFEKACRGPLNPVANEYAWGSTTVTAVTNFFGTDGSGMETALPANANCCYNNIATVGGPVRCGLFATTSSTRTSSGATYWGIMELNGNMWDLVIVLGNTAGRCFSGLHGDGKLDVSGNANVTGWPGIDAIGNGFRGGSYSDGSVLMRVSDRSYSGNWTDASTNRLIGYRAVRTVPMGIIP